VDVNATNDRGNTALYTACIMGHETTALALLDAPDIDLHAKDRTGWPIINHWCKMPAVQSKLLELKPKTKKTVAGDV